MSQKKSKQLRRMFTENVTNERIQKLAELSRSPNYQLSFMRKPFRARNIVRFIHGARLVKYPMPPYVKDASGKLNSETWAATWVLPQ